MRRNQPYFTAGWMKSVCSGCSEDKLQLRPQMCGISMNIHAPAVTQRQPAGAKTCLLVLPCSVLYLQTELQVHPEVATRMKNIWLLSEEGRGLTSVIKDKLFFPFSNTFYFRAPALHCSERCKYSLKLQFDQFISNQRNTQTHTHTRTHICSDLPAIKANLITDHKPYQT